jgi:DNA-binding GntR family transcriptional regulator
MKLQSFNFSKKRLPKKRFVRLSFEQNTFKTAPQVSTHLGIESGDAGLVVERRTWLRGQPVTHVVFTYPAAAHELVARFSPSAEV